MTCLLMGGPDRVIEIDGTRYKFEMHPRLGPCPKKQHGERHIFWKAVTWWSQQGERVGHDGLCVFDWPPRLADVADNKGGGNWLLKPDGDDGGHSLEDITKYGRARRATPTPPPGEPGREP